MSSQRKAVQEHETRSWLSVQWSAHVTLLREGDQVDVESADQTRALSQAVITIAVAR
jgi:hypothetical protein